VKVSAVVIWGTRYEKRDKKMGRRITRKKEGK
jgi:lambda repressor-like predicted transcriptional regulator